jgi:tetratricopeptide (TPR) repeat protein
LDNEPDIPEDFDDSELPRGVKAELRGVPKELAAVVGGHLWAAGKLVEDDPAAALEHAKVARRLAARLAVTREAVAETAYAAGEYAIALTEYRTIYRMTGDSRYLPVLADCNRAVGKPEESLRLLQGAQIDDPAQAVEAIIVLAGARDDLGQRQEALRLVKDAIAQVAPTHPGSARLRYAYADLLEKDGKPEEAREWFATVAALDEEGETDVEIRLGNVDPTDEADGLEDIVILEDTPEDDPEDETDPEEDEWDELPETDEESEDDETVESDEEPEDSETAGPADAVPEVQED